jgi:C_GCAxxG_C_C family probable redox protein
MMEKLSKEEIFEILDQEVLDYLSLCGNCAQTSFAVLQEQFELDGGAVLKALTPFPGIALRGETCGAVTGCLMALGLVYGRDKLDDWPGYLASLRPARRFCRRFEREMGSTMCADIYLGSIQTIVFPSMKSLRLSQLSWPTRTNRNW